MSAKTRDRNFAERQITEHEPGSIVADCDTLLDFIGKGLRKTGKYHLLPMTHLAELDARKTRPLQPQLQSPYITDEIAIGELPLTAGQSEGTPICFAAGWRFKVLLEKIEPANATITEPTLLAEWGDAPPEYDLKTNGNERNVGCVAMRECRRGAYANSIAPPSRRRSCRPEWPQRARRFACRHQRRRMPHDGR